MRNRPPCIAWAEKLALRREDLSPADCAALDAHIQTCPACEAAQADYDLLDAQLRALPLLALKPLPRLSHQIFTLDEEADTLNRVPINSRLSARRANTLQRIPTYRRFVFTLQRALPAAVVACLILALLLVFGIQIATKNASLPPGTMLLTYAGHSDYVDAVAWSPDGQYLASGSWDGTVQVWDAHTGRLLTLYQGHSHAVSALAWSPDGQYIASGSWDHTVRVWDSFTGETLRVNSGPIEFVDAVAWSPNGRYVASGDSHNTVLVWNPRTGTTLPNSFIAYTGGILESLAWSPDGRYIAAGFRDKTVRVLQALTGRLLYTYQAHTGDVSALAWSPNSQFIASGSGDHTVRVWNALTGATLFTYTGHSNTVAALAWSPNGRYIASGSWDHTVQVWAAPSTR